MPDIEASLVQIRRTISLGQSQEVEILCRAACQNAPHDPRPRLLFGSVLVQQGRFAEAIPLLRDVASALPDSFLAWMTLGNAFAGARNVHEAIETFGRAIDLDPTRPEPLVSMGHVLQEAGRFEESITYFQKALELDPGLVWPYLGLVLSKTQREEDAVLIGKIQGLIERNDLPWQDRRTLLYALAKIKDDLGAYKESLIALDQATEQTVHNLPPQQRFDAAANWAGAQFTIKTFTTEFFATFAGLGDASDLPLFIVGAPRSGTTLLEQMLTNHPEIGAGGELSFWQEHGGQAFEALKARSPFSTQIATRYLKHLKSCALGKRRVTDKMPTNYTFLGLLHSLFPNARILHCRRHPIDTCLSIYMNAHSMSERPFGNTRYELVEGYLAYKAVADHWRGSIRSDRFLDVDYEELVSNPKRVMRRVLDFCDVTWSNACIRPQDNGRTVSTPSRWQVRQPIYTSSIERWRRYEPWLGEFSRLTESHP